MWIYEKFQSWTDCGGEPENVLTRDEMLDDIMLYWLTNSAASSARLYWESFFQHVGGAGRRCRRVSASFRKEIFLSPRHWAGGAIHEYRLLERSGAGRPFRGVRAARDFRARTARLFPAIPLSVEQFDFAGVTIAAAWHPTSFRPRQLPASQGDRAGCARHAPRRREPAARMQRRCCPASPAS